jgi:hypothetical protein
MTATSAASVRLSRPHETPNSGCRFLFSLEEALDIDRKLARRTQVGFHRLDVCEHLPFVVARAPAVEVSAADGGLEGRRAPLAMGL